MSIIILDGGFLTTIQDEGRKGYQQLGVPVSGAVDIRSMQLANCLVNNELSEAVLEITLIGPKIKFTKKNTISITGADLSPQINGNNILMYSSVYVDEGDMLTFKGVKSGLRSYIAFAGGLDIKQIMGSKSTYLKAMLGGYEGRKLEKNDEIKFVCPNTDIGFRSIKKEGLSNEITLRVIMGPQDDCFTEKGLDTFFTTVYTVSDKFDRMGCRLDGASIEHIGDGNIISDGIALGAIQIPSHGNPIIMLADRQSIGGYTKIANVISVDIPKIAQAKTNDKVRFEKISITKAQDLYIKQNEEINSIKKYNRKQYLNVNNRVYNIVIQEKSYEVNVEEII